MKKIITLIIGLLIAGIIFSQTHPDFTIINQVQTTPVKSQDFTGTCWSFATTSFIETEAIRMGKPQFDLSEMYFVYYAYLDKANDFIRLHGKNNFSEGGQAHDVTNLIHRYGIVPESVYKGLNYNSEIHNHQELVKQLSKILEDALKANEKLSQAWIKEFQDVLNGFLGFIPDTFSYEGKNYTPQSFNKELINFNPEDYIEFTSYTHHPFYKYIDLELPDNWSHDRYYNLPVNELIEIMNYALKNGYSVAWDGDVSEKGFNNNTGKADLSDEDYKEIKETGYQEYRQQTFDDFTTTDDHLMHITGSAKNKAGELYFITKNSWGNYNNYNGYLFISEDYVKIKTIAFMVNKDAVPENIAKKIDLN